MAQDPITGPVRLPGDKASATPGRLPGDVGVITPVEGKTGAQQNYTFNELDFQPKLGQDNFKLRAQDQGFWESTGIRLANLVPNIASQVIEGVGYMGALATEWGSDRDYTNGLIEAAKSIHNRFGEVYRENPEKTWDLSDPAWWGDMAFGLIESASAFAVEGVGLAKLLAPAAKLAQFAGAGRSAMAAVRGGQMVASSATLAYTEGAMSGARVFDEAYQKQYTKLYNSGMDATEADVEARKIASEAAASTVQLNTIINTALNLTALAPLFKSNDEIMEWYMTKGKRQANESYNDWTARIKATTPETLDIQKLLNGSGGVGRLLGESFQEGLEEMTNQFAERRGQEHGEKGTRMKGLQGFMNDLSNYLDDTLDSEGALNFTLGALGGTAQTVLVDNVPMHRVSVGADGKETLHAYDTAQGEDGKYRKKLISSKHRNALGGRDYFENVRDSIVKDIDRIETLNNDLATAIAKKDFVKADIIRASMFNASAINAVSLGLGLNFKAQYEDIQKIDNETDLSEQLKPQVQQLGEALKNETDPTKKQELQVAYDQAVAKMTSLIGVTEAMQKGYAKDKNDDEYKEKARRVTRELDEYDKLWKDIQKRTATGEEWDSRYGDYLFGKEVDLRTRRRVIQDARKDLTEAKARLGQNPNEDPVATQQLQDFQSNLTARDNFEKEEKSIRTAVTNLAKGTDVDAAKKELEKVAEKYGLVGDGEDDLLPAARRVLGILKEKREGLNNAVLEAVQSFETSTDYDKWKQNKPKGTIVDYIKEKYARTAAANDAFQYEQQIAQFEKETDIAQAEMDYIRSTSGKNAYIKSAKATANKLAKKISDRNRSQNETEADLAHSRKNLASMSVYQRKEYAALLQKRIDKLEDDKREVRVKRKLAVQLLNEHRDQGFLGRWSAHFKGFKKKAEVALEQERIIDKEIAELKLRIDELSDLTTEDEVVMPAPPTPKPVTTKPDSVTTVSDTSSSEVDMVDMAMEGVMGSAELVQQLKDEIALITTRGTVEDLMPLGAQIVANVMGRQGNHPFFAKSPEEQRTDTLIAQRFVEKEIEKLVDSFPPEVPIVNELTTALQQVGLNPKQQTEILGRLNNYSQALEAGELQYNADAVAKEMAKDYGLSTDQAALVMQAFEKVHAEMLQAFAPVVEDETGTDTEEAQEQQQEEAEEETEEEAPVTMDTLPGDIPPDADGGTSPVGFDASSLSALDSTFHAGLKLTDAVTVGALTHRYVDTKTENQTVDEDGTVLDSSSAYTMLDTFALNENLNPVYLTPGAIPEGHRVQLVIDRDWKGEINNDKDYEEGGPDKVEDSFAKYTDAEGNLKTDDASIAEMPIKIVDPKTNTTLGYVHRLGWIGAQYPGATNFRNVEDVIRDAEGNIVKQDNVADQQRRVMGMRRKLVQAYNAGMRSGLPTTIVSRRRGHALRVEEAKASELLPDPTLRLAVMATGGGVTTGENGERVGVENVVIPQYLTQAVEGKTAYGNIAGVLVPDAAGRLNFEPLWMDNISKQEVNTVLRAIEIYLSLGNKEVNEASQQRAEAHAAEIEEATGFDVRDYEGLRNFMNQYYTFSQDFQDTSVKANASALGGTSRTPSFRLSIGSRNTAGGKVRIKAGIMYMDKLSYAEVDADGKLNAGFVNVVTHPTMGMTAKTKNLVLPRSGMKGANALGGFNEIRFDANSDSFQVLPHTSYNDYVKSYAKTSLYGKLQMKNGLYTYYAHPTTILDENDVLQADVIPIVPKSTVPITPTGTTEGQVDEDEKKRLAAKFRNVRKNRYGPIDNNARPILSKSNEGTALSLENLQDMLTFTPLENRNGKTPIEVMAELSRLGIYSLPKGFNPFYSC